MAESVVIPNVMVEYTIDSTSDREPLLMVTTRGNADGTATFEVFAQNMGEGDTLASVLNVLTVTLKERLADGQA